MKYLALFYLLFNILMSSGEALAFSTGLEYSAGPIQVTPKVSEEIEKSGRAQLLRIFSHQSYGRFELSSGLGLQSSRVEGTNTELGVKQFYELKSPTIDFGTAFRFFYGLRVGVLVRNQFGRGASYGVEDENRWVYVFSAGPTLIYRLILGKFTLSAGGNYMTNVPSTQRTVVTKTFSVGLSYTFNKRG